MPETDTNEDCKFFCPTCNSIYRDGFEHCPLDQTTLLVLVDDPMVGLTLGSHYIIDKCVGEGAMGRVYLAHHARLTRRRFAIKVLLVDVAADPTMRKRFGQEAEAASRLQHPNVVSVLDYGKTDKGLLYLVMEFVEGLTLGERVERGPIPEEETITLCKGLCLGLTHAHDQGLVHRDFKPDNVVLVKMDQKTVPKILDFGLAIITTSEESSVRLTTAGMVVGTPAYVSPEQARALPVDHRTDLFALGVAMYEMLSGRLPFDGGVIDILYANATKDPPPIAERSPGIKVSEELEAVVLKLMAREQEERYQSAADVFADLQVLDKGEIPARITQQIRAQEKKKLEAALTQVPDAGHAISGATIAGLESANNSQEEKKRKRAWFWVAGILCFAAVGAFAFTKLGGVSEKEVSENTSGKSSSVKKALPAPKNIEPPAETVAPPPLEVEGIDPKETSTEGIEPEKPEDPIGVVETPPENEDGKSKGRLRNRDRNKTKQGVKLPSKEEGGGSAVPDSTEPNPGLAPDVETTPEPPEEDPKPEVVPPKVVEVTPKPIIPPVVHKPPPPKPKIFDASTSIVGLSAKGSLSSREVKKAVERRASALRSCYKTNSKRANAVPRITARVSFIIDESGRARNVNVSGATLPGLKDCIASSFKKVQTQNAPDVGTVRVSLTVNYAPK